VVGVGSQREPDVTTGRPPHGKRREKISRIDNPIQGSGGQVTPLGFGFNIGRVLAAQKSFGTSNTSIRCIIINAVR